METGAGILKIKDDEKKLLPVVVILSCWFLMNLLQAIFTGLFNDEALFWDYAQHLDWGFYEHPPMVGLLIRAGYMLMHNEPGLRLFFILSSTLSLFLLMRISEVKDYLLFASLCFSALIIHIGGFIAAPDVPLMLFIILFFLVYQEFLKNDRLWIAIAWGMIMAAMIYSKYNGILVILLTILSNLKLLRRRSFYIAACTALLLFVPHIIWSFRSGHPTVYYHLIERNIESNGSFQYLGDFITGQLLLYGPLTSIFFFWFAFTFKVSDPFEKSLKYVATGIFLFFLLYNFRDRVEANWTLPGFIALFVLAYRALEKKIRYRRFILWIGAVSIFLFLFLRVYLVYDFLKLPRETLNLSELYHWREWAQELKQRAGGRPVAILNSYQRTSKYYFYTGDQACGLDEWDSHRTQFWYWSDLEKNIQGKDVLLAHFMWWVKTPEVNSFQSKNGVTTYYSVIKHFTSFYRLPVTIPDGALRYPAGTEVKIPVRIINPDGVPLSFGQDTSWRSVLTYHIYRNGSFVTEQQPSTDLTAMVIRGAFADTTMKIRTPDKPGDYYFWVSIRTGWLPSARNDHPHIMNIY